MPVGRVLSKCKMNAMEPRIRFGLAICTALTFNAHALTPDQVFERVKDSIVIVRTLDKNFEDVKFGSGVLLPSGNIGTNCHVIKGGEYFLVGRNNKYVPASLFAENEEKDICILEAKEKTGKPAQLGSSRSLRVGQRVYAIGAPEGLELSLSEGLVSQIRDSLIQTSAPISHGSSGGGLFDSNAQLLGFTTLTIKNGQNLNFAAPVEWLAYAKLVTRLPSSPSPEKASPEDNPLPKKSIIPSKSDSPSKANMKENGATNHRSQNQSPSQRTSLIKEYQQRIRAKIKSYVQLPPSFVTNSEVVFQVHLLPNGEVSRLTLAKSSGQPTYDSEIEKAILMSSPWPLPIDKEAAADFLGGITIVWRHFPDTPLSENDTANPGGDIVTQPTYAPDNPAIVYPDQAGVHNIQGKVILRVEVLPDGKPGRMWLKQSSGSGLLDQDAQTQLGNWRFIPARKNGQPVTAWIDVPVLYQLQDSSIFK